jgi:hypothetical protein
MLVDAGEEGLEFAALVAVTVKGAPDGASLTRWRKRHT